MTKSPGGFSFAAGGSSRIPVHCKTALGLGCTARFVVCAHGKLSETFSIQSLPMLIVNCDLNTCNRYKHRKGWRLVILS